MKRANKIEVARSHNIMETNQDYGTPDVYNVYNLCNNIVSPKDETVELNNITEEVLFSALLSEEPDTYFRDQRYSAECFSDGRSLNQRLPMESQGRVHPWKEGCSFSSPSVKCGGI